MSLVLFVHPDAHAAGQLAEVLRRRDHEIIFAPTIDQMLCFCAEREPDVIIASGALAGDLLTAVRADVTLAHVIVIVLEDDPAADPSDWIIAGADDALIAPFNASHLLAIMRARLVRRDQLRERSDHELRSLKRGVARIITHELRTPLIAINAVIDILIWQGATLPEESRDLFETLRKGARALAHRVDQLVFHTQLEAGVLTPHDVRENGMALTMHDLLIAAVNLGRRFAFRIADGVTVDVRDDGAEVVLHGHPPSLKQALGEIIANAIAYAPEHTAVVVSQSLEGDQVWISIDDRGQGMSEEQIAAIDHAFSQIDRDTHEQQGLGIGLSLARRLITVHGGSLTIQSRPGKGTRVQVRLPLR